MAIPLRPRGLGFSDGKLKQYKTDCLECRFYREIRDDKLCGKTKAFTYLINKEKPEDCMIKNKKFKNHSLNYLDNLIKNLESPDWNADRQLWFLPCNVQQLFRQEANLLRYQLSEYKHKLSILPTNDPRSPSGMAFFPLGLNPNWYSQLYNQYNKEVYRYESKKFERRRSFGALSRIIHQKDMSLTDYVVKRRIRIDKPRRESTKRIEKTKTRGAYCKYDAIFRQLIYERLAEGYDDIDGRFIPPNNEVRKFFKLSKFKMPE